MKAYSATLATGKAAKRNTMTLQTDPHACIEIENHATLFLWSLWLAA